MRLYNRNVAVTIARPQSYWIQAPNGIIVRDLRVTFKIELTLEDNPNTCDVAIYNLADATRKLLREKPIHVRLDAGYDGNLERLFTGDVRWGQSKHLDGVTWESKLQLGDGARAMKHARISRSYKAGANPKTLIQDAAAAMGLKVPTSVAAAKEMYEQFATGVTLEGPANGELTRLLKPKGFSHSVQNGELQILRGGEARETEALVISQSSGLIGVPEFGVPAEKGESPILSFRCLLKPELSPGRAISLVSRNIKGLFRCERVVHSGDTHGDEWFTDVEAKPL